MSTQIAAPPQNEFLDPRTTEDAAARPTTSWTAFFSVVYNLLNGLTTSGTTAQRPTTRLFVGRTYFDTSLGAHGKPIWVASVAAGVATWIDSASNVV